MSSDPTNCRGIRTPNGNLAIDQVFFTSDFVLTSNAFDPTSTLESSTVVFEDPENHDFTLNARGVEAGDPRWLQ